MAERDWISSGPGPGSVFVGVLDEEPATVDARRSRGVRTHSFDVLSGARVRELRAGGKPATRCTSHVGSDIGAAVPQARHGDTKSG